MTNHPKSVTALVIKADPSPTVAMYRLLAQCERANADNFDAMADALEAKYGEQNLADGEADA